MLDVKSPLNDLHISNSLTYLSALCAVLAVAASGAGNIPAAGLAIAVAAIADTFDGRFARSFARSTRQARIGHELDSLVDVAAFALAPVVVLDAALGYVGAMWMLSWSAGGLYVLAAVTRLAFYNVEENEAQFVGLPAPAAALLCVTSLLLPAPAWAAAWPLVAGGALMVAPVAFPRPRGVGLLVFASWGVALISTLAWRAVR